jgi:hypothetical protein
MTIDPPVKVGHVALPNAFDVAGMLTCVPLRIFGFGPFTQMVTVETNWASASMLSMNALQPPAVGNAEFRRTSTKNSRTEKSVACSWPRHEGLTFRSSRRTRS